MEVLSRWVQPLLGSNTAAWLVKFDVGGNILWSRTYDDANIYGIAGNNIIQTTDGGYAFSGTYSNQPTA